MKKSFEFYVCVYRFDGRGGWYYVLVPMKYKKDLNKLRPAWGMFPILVSVGKTSWNTKLMIKKGGDFLLRLRKLLEEKKIFESVKELKFIVL